VTFRLGLVQTNLIPSLTEPSALTSAPRAPRSLDKKVCGSFLSRPNSTRKKIAKENCDRPKNLDISRARRLQLRLRLRAHTQRALQANGIEPAANVRQWYVNTGFHRTAMQQRVLDPNVPSPPEALGQERHCRTIISERCRRPTEI